MQVSCITSLGEYATHLSERRQQWYLVDQYAVCLISFFLVARVFLWRQNLCMLLSNFHLNFFTKIDDLDFQPLIKL